MSFIEKFNYNRDRITDTAEDVSIPSNLKGFVDHAYGFRKIHPDYAGYCCRLRKKSNDNLVDFKFDKDGKLSLNSTGYTINTQALVGTLSSWIGSDDGELEILYDQGGIGQATPSDAINLEYYTGYVYRNPASSYTTLRDAGHTNPIIVSGGSLLTNNGVPTAKLTGSGIMAFNGGYESDGTPSGLHSIGGVSETFLVGMISGTGTNNEGDLDPTDTANGGASSSQYKVNQLLGGHIYGWKEDLQIGEIDDQFVFSYENTNTRGFAITGGPVVYNQTQLWSSFTNTIKAGFKVNNFRQTGQFDAGTEVRPKSVSSDKTPKYIGLGGKFAFSPSGNDVGKGEFQELIFSTQTLSDAQRLGMENYMSNYFNFFSLDSSILSTQEKIQLGFDIFTPTYGAQMSFEAENSSWKGSNFYQFISPMGLNNLRLKSKLSFINDLGRTKKLLNYIESITAGDLTGEQAFTGDTSYLNFGSPKNGIEISLGGEFYRNFSGSQIVDYTVVDLSSDVYKVDVSLFNNTVSPVLNNGMGFISDKTMALSDGRFKKFDIAGQIGIQFANSNTFDNYFYLTTDRVNAINVSNVTGASTYTGVADSSTRTFFWEPDASVPLTINHSNRTEFFKNSFVKTLNISQNQNNLNQINLTFTNRSEKETYSLLHFLETHLGYKHFVYYHDNDVINKNRVFYCPKWTHDFVYKDSNNINATFVEIVAPTLPEL